jgi:glucose-1-phosphate cytidylyltransferase
MKVVLFCGGLGMRLRDYSETIPKPMVPIGPRPILWHLMKYYSHFGHCEFIVCLGHAAEAVKKYFLSYDECLSNDFVLSSDGRTTALRKDDLRNWTITFVDTGKRTNIAGRMLAIREHLGDDEVFLANYADGLSDLPLEGFVNRFLEKDKVAQFVSVRPTTYFHIVSTGNDGTVERVVELPDADLWMNGGFFVFRQSIFDYINPGEELVDEPFSRLIDEGQLVTERYDGFWRSMDTFKDKQALDELYERDRAPWVLWDKQ